MRRVSFAQPPRFAQRGLSLIELMVGVALGLFIVAAATSLVAGQLSDNRRLLLETQLQQDLRASMDIITRQLRRAGAVTMPFVQGAVASPSGGAGPANPFSGITTNATGIEEFKFYFDASQQGPYGFKLDSVGGVGVIKTRLPAAGFIAGGWHDLTDATTLNVTAFTVMPTSVPSAALPCPKLCPGGGTACWPQLVVRDYVVEITAQSRSDAAVQRSMRNHVRVRNDWLKFNAAALCPA